MSRYGKTDHNQSDIVQDLRSTGASVQSLHAVGQGVPDLLVCLGKQLFLLEIKQPKSRKRLSQAQIDFHAKFPTSVVTSSEEALRAIGVLPWI